MKPSPVTANRAESSGSARVEFTVQFSRGPKGKRRVSPAAASMIVPEGVTSAGATPRPIASAQVPVSTAIPTRGALVTVQPRDRPVRSQAPVAPTIAAPVTAAPAATVPTLTAAASSPTLGAPSERVPKITLLLALGHHFERLVRDGAVKDYAKVARVTGLTRARVTQICNLTLLAPDIQEAILDLTPTAQGEDPAHERSLRAVVAEPDWRRQQGLRPRSG